MAAGNLFGLRRGARAAAGLALLALLGPLAQAAATGREVIGGLRSVEGQTVIVRDGREIFARSGMRVFNTDILRTGAAASLAVVLRDETRISIGPESEVVLEQFLYEPEGQRFGMTTRVLSGTVQFVTGALAQVAPQSVTVRTPVSTIGIRGTRFLVEVD